MEKIWLQEDNEAPTDRCFVCGTKFEYNQKIYDLRKDYNWVGCLCSKKCYKKWQKWFSQEWERHNEANSI